MMVLLTIMMYPAFIYADGPWKNWHFAKALDLSLFTVKNHVSNILMKLHVRSRTEAAAFILSPE